MNFSDYVTANGHSNLPSLLPLVHNTNASNLSLIFDSGEIAVRTCKHFQKELVYCFYGRAAYMEQTGSINFPNTYAPVSLIIKPEGWQMQLSGIFPFDTGAFMGGTYADLIPQRSMQALQRYQLESNLEQVRKAIALFFGTNDAYRRGEPVAPAAGEPSMIDNEAYCYHHILRLPIRGRADCRGKTVEIQLENPIPLNRSAIETLIVPRQLSADVRFVQAVASSGLDLQYYGRAGGSIDDQWSSLREFVDNHVSKMYS